ncbi:DUF6596 domain-containing protein [Streptomyces sp. NPDC059787]|uniref:DUF6596 domain-containing protein n=1 Tax=Streptomyces sp. NPDC059787 TaxID=3346947 RepID=UPI0036583D41
MPESARLFRPTGERRPHRAGRAAEGGRTAGADAAHRRPTPDARRPARSRPDGALVPLTEQDRSRWSREYIAEGVALGTDAPAPRTARPVPAPGSDRRGARRGGAGGGHRPAADPGAPPAARTHGAHPSHGDARPRGRAGHGGGTAGGLELLETFFSGPGTGAGGRRRYRRRGPGRRRCPVR